MPINYNIQLLYRSASMFVIWCFFDNVFPPFFSGDPRNQNNFNHAYYYEKEINNLMGYKLEYIFKKEKNERNAETKKINKFLNSRKKNPELNDLLFLNKSEGFLSIEYFTVGLCSLGICTILSESQRKDYSAA